MRGLDCALRNLAVGQSPLTLTAEWQREEFPQGELSFLAIGSNTYGDGVLRTIATQRVMQFVPPAENCAPIGIGLALHDRMMNAVHARRDNDQIQNSLDANWESP